MIAAKWLFTWVVTIYPMPERQPVMLDATALYVDDEKECRAMEKRLHEWFDDFGYVVTKCDPIPAHPQEKEPAEPAKRGSTS